MKHSHLTAAHSAIEEALVHPIEPAMRWYLMESIARAISDAHMKGYNEGRADGYTACETEALEKYRDKNIEGVPAVTYTNGVAGVSDGVQSAIYSNYPIGWDGTAPAPPEGRPGSASPLAVEAMSTDTPFDLPKPAKRGRGRPKGAKGKKKKQLKQTVLLPADVA